MKKKIASAGFKLAPKVAKEKPTVEKVKEVMVKEAPLKVSIPKELKQEPQEINQRDIYLKLKQEFQDKKKINVFEDTENLFDKIVRIKFKQNIFEPLQTPNMILLKKEIARISNTHNLNYRPKKLNKEVIDILKIQAYLENSKDKKFLLAPEQLDLVLGYHLLDNLLVSALESAPYFKIEKVKGNSFFHKVLKVYLKINNLKAERDNYSIMFNTFNLVEKYLLMNLELDTAEIMDRVCNYLKHTHTIKNPVKTFNKYDISKKEAAIVALKTVLTTKKLVFVDFNTRTNLDWFLINGRLKKIRNFLTRSKSENYYIALEKSIQKVFKGRQTKENLYYNFRSFVNDVSKGIRIYDIQNPKDK